MKTVNAQGRWYETFAPSALHAVSPAAPAADPKCLTISAALRLSTASIAEDAVISEGAEKGWGALRSPGASTGVLRYPG
jgi:hypothetical protein